VSDRSAKETALAGWCSNATAKARAFRGWCSSNRREYSPVPLTAKAVRMGIVADVVSLTVTCTAVSKGLTATIMAREDWR
jgi:hypothetical protein